MNRSIYIFCSIFIFFSFSSAKNQETSISGTVYRNEEAFPLQGANVTLLNTNGDEYGMSTDENGFFSITDLKPGNYSIKISFIGFEDYTENVNIEFGRLYKIDAILSIEPIQMTKLEIISKVVKERGDVDPVEFAFILSEIDFNLSKEANSIIHLTNFLTKLGSLG